MSQKISWLIFNSYGNYLDKRDKCGTVYDIRIQLLLEISLFKSILATLGDWQYVLKDTTKEISNSY